MIVQENNSTNELKNEYFERLINLSNQGSVEQSGNEESMLEYIKKIAEILGIENLKEPQEEDINLYMEVLDILESMTKINESDLDIENIIAELLGNIITDFENGGDFLYTDDYKERIKQNPMYLAKFIVDLIYYRENSEDMSYEICEKCDISLSTLNEKFLPVFTIIINEILEEIKVKNLSEFVSNFKYVYCKEYNI